MDIPFIGSQAFTPIQLTDLSLDLQAIEEQTSIPITRTKPTKTGPGEKYGKEVIEAFHDPVESPGLLASLFGDIDKTPKFSYELWFDSETLSINWTLPSSYWSNKFRDIVTGEYPKIGIERISDTFVPYNEDDYVAGGTVTLRSNQYIPIKSLSGHGQFEEDKAPLRLLTSEIAADKTCSVCVQVLFKPAKKDWRDDPHSIRPLPADTKANYLREGRVVESWTDPRLEDPTEKDLKQAQAINDHEGEAAFQVTIRYFVFGSEKSRVQSHVKQVGDAYRSTYNNRELNQGFTVEDFTGKTLTTELEAAINREFTRTPDPLTIPELAALAHIPNGEVDTPEINWTSQAVRSQVPSAVPRKVESIFPTPYNNLGTTNATTADALTDSRSQLPPDPDEQSLLERKLGVQTVHDLTMDDAESIVDILGLAPLETNPPDPAEELKARRLWNEGERAIPPNIPESRHAEYNTLVDQIVLGELSPNAAVNKWNPSNKAEFRDNLSKVVELRQEDRQTKAVARAALLIKHHPDYLEKLLQTAERNASQSSSTAPPESDANLPDTTPEYNDASVTPVDATYEWQEDPHTQADRPYEIKIEAADGNTYLGRDPKAELFDIHEEYPDSPLWLGWTRDNRVGVREVGLEKMSWFRHMSVFGLTGTGKSTFNNNLMIQVAKKGYGFCYIDPKGDGVRDILTQIPEERTDDIIWIEPGSPDYDKVVGINFLEAAYDRDHPNYDREVSAMIDDLTSILKGGDYWGPRMEGITTNIARAMIRSEIEFNLMDMYYVLRSDESRESFAENIRQEGEQLAKNGEEDRFVDDMRNISTYTEQIAKMDAGEVDAVVRRIQSWVENPIARGVIAHREGTVNITEAVENGKILLVNLDIDSRDIKGVVATAIMRRVWAAIKARREDEQDRSPYFSFLDEFDDIASPDMDIEKMLSKARSGKMGVNLTLQNPSQIPEGPRQQMFSNARTVNSFGIGERSDADLISSRFPDEVEYSDIMEIPQFTLYTRVVMQTDEGRKLSPTLPINSFPDYPPVRTDEQAEALIQKSLDTYGVKPLTETLQDTQMVLFNMGNNVNVHNAFLQAVWEVQIKREVEYASLAAVNDAFKERTGKEFYEYPNGIQIDPEWCDIKKLPEQAHDPDELAEEINDHAAASGGTDIDPTAPETPSFTEPQTNAKGKITLTQTDGVARITKAGKDKILKSDHQYVPPSEEHNDILKDGIFEWFTRVGFQVNIVTQHNKESLPDAEGHLPVESETPTLAEARRQMERLESKNELLAEISDGKEVALEAEYSLTKQISPLNNLTRAANNNRRAIFMVGDGRGDDRLKGRTIEGDKRTYWARRLDNLLNHPPLVRDYNVETFDDDDDDANTRTQVERTLYNTSSPLRLSTDPNEQKFPVLEKDADVVWIEQDEAALVLRNGSDGDATTRGTLGIDGLDDASANSFSIWCRYDKYEDEWVVYPEQSSNRIYETKEELLKDWQLVNRPFHPRTDIGPDYTDLDPLITILPAEEYIETPEDAVPLVYHRDDPDANPTLEPLIPGERLAEWDANHFPRYNPIDTTPEALQTPIANDDRLAFDAFLETYEVKEMNLNTLIPDTDAPYNPQYTPDTTFSGNKHPTERRYWETVFAACADAHEDIQDIRLSVEAVKDGIKQGLAQMNNHEAAIRTGVKSGQLCVLNGGLILAKGWDRPKVVLETPETYAQRSFWADVYQQVPMADDETDTIPKRVLPAPVTQVKFNDPDDSRHISHARAAVAYAIMTDTLLPADDSDNPPLKLCSPGRPTKWKKVWKAVQEPYDAPLEKATVISVLPGADTGEDISFDNAVDHVEQAIYNRKTLKETDSGLVITPPGDGGPLDPDDTPDHLPPGDDNNDDSEPDSKADASEPDATTEQSPSAEPTATTTDTTPDPDADTATTEATTPDATDTPPTADTPPQTDTDPAPHADTDDEDGPDYAELVDEWAFTPTEEPPGGWTAAFDAAIDAYHDAATETIPANKQYNALVEHLTDYLDEEATCTSANPDDPHGPHDHYVGECPNCRVIDTCTECGDTQRSIVRVEYESCGDDCTDIHTPHTYRLQDDIPTPPGTCNECLERRYCAECAAAASVDPLAEGPTETPHENRPERRPLTVAINTTCYKCGTDGFKANAETDTDCYCETQTVTAPPRRLPETAEDYFTGPEWDTDFAPEDFLGAGHEPNADRYGDANTDGRNWTQDAFEDNRLGWAPATPAFNKPIVEQLVDEGYTPAQLYATGLFKPDWKHMAQAITGEWGSIEDETIIAEHDVGEYLIDDDHDLTAAHMVKPRWKGRVIFPYFIDTDRTDTLTDLLELNIPDADLETLATIGDDRKAPVYACSRIQSTFPHPGDAKGNKYDKMKEYEYVWATEPIWGTETLEEHETVVVTEGIADAIAAADDGICVLSPVTTRFKTEHEALLQDLCETYDIRHVRIVQDNEPASFSRLDADDISADGRADASDTLEKYDRLLDSESQDLAAHIDAGEPAPGPLSAALEIDAVPPGLTGAFSIADTLRKAGRTPIHVDLPRLTTEKIDLDDYLSSGLYEYHPLLPKLASLHTTLPEADEKALMKRLEASGRFGALYEAGYQHWRQEVADDTHTDPIPGPDEFYLSYQPTQAECLRRGLAIANDDDVIADQRTGSIIIRRREESLTDADGRTKTWRDVDAPSITTSEWDALDTAELIDAAVEGASGDFSLTNIIGRLGALTTDEGTIAQPVQSIEPVSSQPVYDFAGDTTESITPLFTPPRVCDPTAHPQYKWYLLGQLNSGTPGAVGDDHDGGSHSTSGRQSALYDITLEDVTGLSAGFRGKNPLGHTGNSENYWKLYAENLAWDFKRKAPYNALLYLAVEANVRPLRNPTGTFSDAELLETWVHAKDNGHIDSDDSVPLRAMRAAAADHDICTPDERVEKEIGSGEDATTINDALPDNAYNAVLEIFEDEYGVSPGRHPMFNEAQFTVEGLTTENSIDVFAEQYLTTDVDESDTEKPEYDYPRVPVEDVWQAYKHFCEINDIDAKSQYAGAKKEIGECLGVERKSLKWEKAKKNKMRCFSQAKLTSEGRLLADNW